MSSVSGGAFGLMVSGETIWRKVTCLSSFIRRGSIGFKRGDALRVVRAKCNVGLMFASGRSESATALPFDAIYSKMRSD